jgi:hypothetical protein
MKKLKIILVISILFATGFISGCTEHSTNDKTTETTFFDISPFNITLVEQDFTTSFTKVKENHITETTIVENITGNEITWEILEQYDVTFYANITNGVMETILKLNSSEKAYNLTLLSKNNLLDINYTQQSIETIGDVSFLLNRTITYQNNNSQYYTLLFSMGNIFVALGGSAPEKSSFIDYATTIENNILNVIEQ